MEILKSKRKGTYNIVKIDPAYQPNPVETKQVYGITFEQGRNEYKIDKSLLDQVVTQNKNIPEQAKEDLVIALITLKYTQSNSVCYAKDGQAIGVGAGQQSRIHCTRLAGNKADIWHLRQHEKVLNLPFKESLRRLTATTASMFIFLIRAKTCWATMFGKTFLPVGRTAHKRRKRALSFGYQRG